MYSVIQRLNSVSALATSTLLYLLAVIAVTSLFIPTPFTPAQVEVPKIQVIWGRDQRDYHNRQEREYAHLRFTLRADVRPLFTWNTKQLFLYLTADYAADVSGYPENRVVVWDRIVRRKEDARVNVEGMRNKYAFKEIGGSFRDVSANFTLHYNVMPYVGFLTWGEAGATTEQVAFPPSRRNVES